MFREDLDNFHKAAISLKLFSRAELSDDRDRSIIEQLYVDPLPNEQAFKTLLSDTTTIIIGRKGTGKSTIFQRVQQEIRKNKHNTISSYMDIRNVYESAQVDQSLIEKAEETNISLPAEEAKKLLIYNGFIRALVTGIRDDLKKQVEQSFLTKLKERISGTAQEVFEGLDRVISKLDKPVFENIIGLRTIDQKSSTKNSSKNSYGSNIEASAKEFVPDIKLQGQISNDSERVSEGESNHTDVLMRVIGVNDIIEEIKIILDSIGVKYLYIFLDDFSELPEDAMRTFVDVIISPFTRWSSFIKFKIAAYPGRVYLGTLDRTKVEEFYLDSFHLYGAADVVSMEEKATEFTHRLVERRIEHFCELGISDYFEENRSDFWRIIFYATMGNPRILGHILLYAYESHLIYGRKIGIKSINEAAQRYYEEKVSSFFVTAQFKNSFHERSSIFSLKELLENVVTRARKLKDYKSSQVTSNISGRTPSSHFHVSVEFDDLLTSLELAFFISKYYEQSNRDGARVSVYALNYGLCEKYQIGFGRPSISREHRLYFIERIFDYNSIIRAYISENQEIKCKSCGTTFDNDMLDAIKKFRMRCPECASGICTVTNLSRKYADLLNSVKAEMLLPETELGILQTLHTEDREMRAAEIAEDLDCSGQLVGRRAKNLAEQDLVTREQAGAVKRYSLTRRAKQAYFSDSSASDLDVEK